MTVRGRLRDHLDRDLKAATAEVLNDPDADISAELSRIKTYERLLAVDNSRPGRRRMLAVVIGITCVTMVGLAQIVRMPTARITLAVDAQSVSFNLAKDWEWDESVGNLKQIRLDGFDKVELPTSIPRDLSAASDDMVNFANGKLTFSSLKVKDGGEVTLDADEHAVDLFVRGATVNGEIAMQGPVEVEMRSNDIGSEARLATPDFMFAELVPFEATPTGAVPVQIRLEGGSDISVQNVPIQTLSFAKERTSGALDRRFESTISSGNLNITETRNKMTLGRGDHVEIGEAVDARLVEMAVGDGISIAFEGKVGILRLVQAGTATDLRPTVLEYTYHNERLIFLWSALGVLWGFVWSVRRTMF